MKATVLTTKSAFQESICRVRGMRPNDLRRFRVLHSLPQGDIANILGVTRQMIVAMESRDRLLPTWVGLALAAYEAGLQPYVAPEGTPLKLRVDRPSRRARNRLTAANLEATSG